MPTLISLCFPTIPPRIAPRWTLYLKTAALATTFALSQGASASTLKPAVRVTIDSVKTDGSRVVRADLTPQEAAASQPAVITLNLRNREELASRIAKGDIISPAEMEARYYPTHETWQAVAFWASSQRLLVEPENATHMSVRASGHVAQVASAFQTHFARVLGSDQEEYTAAIAPATIPVALAPFIAGVLGLQPQHRLRTATIYPPIAGTATYGPQDILDHYGATGVGDGTGQVIAVYGYSTPPNATDLTTFWMNIGSPHTMADVTVINPNNYPVYDDNDATSLAGDEVTFDVETISALCPGAKIRIYCLGPYVDAFATAAEAVIADLPAFPGIHVFSMSVGAPESEVVPSSQYFMALAAQGVTTFASSGDGGSNPGTSGSSSQAYSASAPLAVYYPASDPYVTGVGGTYQQLEIVQSTPGSSTFIMEGVTAEVAWTGGTNPAWTNDGVTFSGGDSGGGVSTIFVRPSWQTGPGVPAGTMRCVPDVAATAAANGPLYTYVGRNSATGGTSESAPVWAALCAILNQSLQATGHSPVGLLGPKLYPLAGTGAMNYVAQGYFNFEFGNDPTNYPSGQLAWTPLPAGAVDTNGAYNVGPTYDMITGIGTPNIALIAEALEAPPAGLSVSVATHLPSGRVVNGSAPITLQASATGSPTGYQWELNGVPIAGATGATEIVYPTAANEGDYTIVVTNSAGSASTDAGTLSVTTDAWIVNLSSRAYAETGANLLIVGFVTTGPTTKTVLIRGDGPSLAGFNIPNFLPDPKLTLISGSTTIASTISWSTTLDPVFAQVGAFSFTPGSNDTALEEALPPGPYTAQVISKTNNSGVALAEIYDADDTAPTNRLINISARAFVGTGPDILIGGFVIGGNTPQTVIIRGDGPALTGFGLPGALAATTLTLSNGTGTIATNAGWTIAPVTGPQATGGIIVQPLTAALSARVGAFALTTGSNDSAIVATLPPGSYTAQVTGANNSTGVALVEIYELR